MRGGDESTRKLLLDAAIEAFSRKGYAGTSIQTVLEDTGVSKPTLYNYFESKDRLFQAIIDFAYDEAFRRMRTAALSATTCPERLLAIAADLFQFAEGHESLMRVVFGAVFLPPDEVSPTPIDTRKRVRNFEFLSEIMREGQMSGSLDPRMDAVEITHIYYGMVTHFIRARLLQPSMKLDRARAERAVALFLNGARKPPGAKAN